MEQRDSLLLEPLSGYPRAIGVWIAALQDSRRRTLEVLEGIRSEWVDFAPENEESIGTILYHLAAIEADWLYAEVLQRAFPPEIEALLHYDVRDNDGKLMPVSDTLEHHLERLKIVREYLLESFLDLTLDTFEEPHVLPQYDVSPVWVLHHLMQHEAEHRSQINATGMKATAALGK